MTTDVTNFQINGFLQTQYCNISNNYMKSVSVGLALSIDTSLVNRWSAIKSGDCIHSWYSQCQCAEDISIFITEPSVWFKSSVSKNLCKNQPDKSLHRDEAKLGTPINPHTSHVSPETKTVDHLEGDPYLEFLLIIVLWLVLSVIMEKWRIGLSIIYLGASVHCYARKSSFLD